MLKYDLDFYEVVHKAGHRVLGLGLRSTDLSEDLGFYDGGPRGPKQDHVIRDSATLTETERARARERGEG